MFLGFGLNSDSEYDGNLYVDLKLIRLGFKRCLSVFDSAADDGRKPPRDSFDDFREKKSCSVVRP